MMLLSVKSMMKVYGKKVYFLAHSIKGWKISTINGPD